MDRDIQETQQSMAAIQHHLRSALLADTTADLVAESNSAMALTDQVLQSLKAAADAHNYRGSLVKAAIAALNQAWVNAEKLALGTNLGEMRGTVADFKASIDHADAYLQASSGQEDG